MEVHAINPLTCRLVMLKTIGYSELNFMLNFFIKKVKLPSTFKNYQIGTEM